MKDFLPEKCPFCGSTNIGVGYQLGAGQVYADVYAYHSTRDCSPVEHLFCKDCGSILHTRVVKTDMFHPYNLTRQNELGEYLETHGILLCNENKELPSLCGLGYSMENIIGLIDLRQVFYGKIYKKRSTYLSVRAYQLLRRIKEQKALSPEAKLIYDSMKNYDFLDKDELKQRLDMEKRVFDKAFDFLLENLYVTAFSGKRVNSNWYAYLYCTAERWNKEVEGLHFNGDPRAALWEIVGREMNEKDFKVFCS